MRITKIEVWNFETPFRDGPYNMSHVSQDAIYGQILCLHTEQGISGLGEIVPAPSLAVDERLARYVDESTFLPALVGQSEEALGRFIQQIQAKDKSWRGIAFGLETAYLDLLARSRDVPFADMLGGTLNDNIEDYFSISESHKDDISQRILTAGPDRKVIQLKVGVHPLAHELELIQAALELMNHSQTLLVDANGGWSFEQASQAISSVEDPRLIWEEPCSLYQQNRKLAQELGAKILLDGQTSTDFDVAKQAMNDGIAAGICIKPALIGGLSIAREIRDLCVKADMKIRIDGPWCGDIACTAILNLALGTRPDLLIAGCDLREPLIIDPDLKGLTHPRPSQIAPAPSRFNIDWVREQLGPATDTYI
ncbi:MAG: mandelate racemase/muconate lactonizing enzyme family protein [Arenicellales bacterium]